MLTAMNFPGPLGKKASVVLENRDLHSLMLLQKTKDFFQALVIDSRTWRQPKGKKLVNAKLLPLGAVEPEIPCGF